jgi:hypothetical protein
MKRMANHEVGHHAPSSIDADAGARGANRFPAPAVESRVSQIAELQDARCRQDQERPGDSQQDSPSPTHQPLGGPS